MSKNIKRILWAVAVAAGTSAVIHRNILGAGRIISTAPSN